MNGMTRIDRFRFFAAFALALAVLAVGPGCGGGGPRIPNPLGPSGGPLPAAPPPIVGHVTGTWQGNATDALSGLAPPAHPSSVVTLGGPLTLVIARDGKFAGTLRDTATGENVALAGTILNYEQGGPFLDPKKHAGTTARGATLTFAGRSFDVSGMFVLEPDGRLIGRLFMNRTASGNDGAPAAYEWAQANFTLVKQE